MRPMPLTGFDASVYTGLNAQKLNVDWIGQVFLNAPLQMCHVCGALLQ